MEQRSYTILMVGQKNLNAQYIKTILQKEGYRVIFEGNHKNLVQIVEKTMPQVIVIAENLKNSSMLEQIYILKAMKQACDIPILLALTKNEDINQVAIINIECDDIIFYPFNRRELLYRVKTLLKLKQINDMMKIREDILFEIVVDNGHEKIYEEDWVLIVEDNGYYMKMISDIVQSLGMKIQQARDGKEAIDLLNRYSIRLAIIDLYIPEGNGIDLCRYIKNHENLHGIPVIIVTGSDDEEMQIQGIEAGADDYVTKPIHGAIFRARIQSLLRSSHKNLKISRQYKHVLRQAATDALTGLYNNVYIKTFIKKQIEISMHQKIPFSFIMIDIDNFKHFNDTYGHLWGDYALKDIANIINQNIRRLDVGGRYGGEEFAVILSGVGKENAYEIAERIRKIVEGHLFRTGNEKDCETHLTISLGIAVYDNHPLTFEDIIEHADKALYEAKKSGKNRSVIWEGSINQ